VHFLQAAPEDSWYLPAGQPVQVVDPAIANLPARHGLHKSALYPAANLAAGHSMQRAEPGTGKPVNVPGTHAGVGDAVGDEVGD